MRVGTDGIINFNMGTLRMTSHCVTEKKSYKKRKRRYCLLKAAGIDDFTRYCLTGLHPNLERVGKLGRGQALVERFKGPIEGYLIKLTK